MKSTFMNMVLVLLVITAVSAAAVGYVYGLTKEPIEQAAGNKKLEALKQVLPAFDNTPAEEVTTATLDGFEINIYTGRSGGEATGYAVESQTGSGFNGNIRIMVGFDTTGRIVNIAMLQQAETPGLGAKLADDNNPVRLSFVGNDPAELKMSVKKDGGDIDAITASTVSSRAYVDAVARAYRALIQQGFIEGDPSLLDSSTGATTAASGTSTGTAAGASSDSRDSSAGTKTGSSAGVTDTDSSTGATTSSSGKVKATERSTTDSSNEAAHTRGRQPRRQKGETTESSSQAETTESSAVNDDNDASAEATATDGTSGATDTDGSSGATTN